MDLMSRLSEQKNQLKELENHLADTFGFRGPGVDTKLKIIELHLEIIKVERLLMSPDLKSDECFTQSHSSQVER